MRIVIPEFTGQPIDWLSVSIFRTFKFLDPPAVCLMTQFDSRDMFPYRDIQIQIRSVGQPFFQHVIDYRPPQTASLPEISIRLMV